MSVYEPTVWKNGQEPFINAFNLNHMEAGITTAHEEIEEILDGTRKVKYAELADKALTVDPGTQTTIGGAKIWVDTTNPDNIIGHIDAR